MNASTAAHSREMASLVKKEKVMRFLKRFPLMALMCWLAAIGARLEAAPSARHAHSHSSEGPHHGMLIELGKEDYHAELVHDDATATVTIYILDSSVTKSVPITAKHITLNMRAGGKPQQFVLAAQPQKGEATGSASAFTVTGNDLCRAIDEHGVTGRLNVEIEGKMYVGKVGGHSHAHQH